MSSFALKKKNLNGSRPLAIRIDQTLTRRPPGLQLGQLAIGFRSAVSEKLPGIADFPDLVKIEVGNNHFVIVFGGLGDFSQRVTVPNRDELGALAGNLNHMSEELTGL